MNFKILHKDKKARVGQLITPHGIVETPRFNPVGTQATVKAILPKDLQEIGVQMVLSNTYHLMLRPGVDVIRKMGGLHKFMNWDRPLMTDSGGFQVFSLGGALEMGSSKVVRSGKDKTREMLASRSELSGRSHARGGRSGPRPRLNQITDEGVVFQSHLDGSKHTLTPETAMKLQYELGADLIVAFDDHEYKDDLKHLKTSLEQTERWALRSIQSLKQLKSDQLMYGVIHGGTDKDLRVSSAKFTDRHFAAIALGGIYGTKKELYQMIDWVMPYVSGEKPRHLLGIGEVEDLFNGVERGVDLFDCVAPTRRARNGSLYISYKSGGKSKNGYTLGIAMSKFKTDKNPIDSLCSCYTCLNFSRAYLRQLYLSKEILYHNLATIHNIYFIENLMRQIREAIKGSQFNKLKSAWI